MSNSITATITPDLLLRSNVTTDSRDNKIIATSISGGSTQPANTTDDVISDIDLGSVEKQDVIESGTTLQDLVELIFTKTYYPTFVAPSLLLSSSLPSNVEAGTIGFSLTGTLNKGAINGANTNGVWDENLKQDDRSGVASKYLFSGNTIDTIEVGSTLTLSTSQIVDNTNSFSLLVDYDQGPQPRDSKDEDYETPLSAGSISKSLNIYGRRKAFYGLDSNSSTSNEIRAFSGSYLNPNNGTTFDIQVLAGTTKVVFAYPASLQDVSRVESANAFGADVKSVFIVNQINVEGANAYNPIAYKVYVYEPLIPFSSADVYTVTI